MKKLSLLLIILLFKNVQYKVLSYVENGLFFNISVNTDNTAALR